jgi:ABC-2 type transport system ATP-binding protein
VRALDAAGVVLSHLQIHEPTLDDVFLAKTGRHLEGSGDGDEEEQEPQRQPVRA